MEAYGQFAWKLRHYRAGPPASNHSSNGPVCRHLGGRLSEKDLLLLPFSLRPLIAAPLLSLSLSLSLSLFLFLLLSIPPPWSHDSDSLSRRIFRLRATSINDGSARFYRRGQGRARSTPTPNPFHDQRPIHFLSFDRYFRPFRNRSSFLFLRSPTTNRVESNFVARLADGIFVLSFSPGSPVERKGRGGKIVFEADLLYHVKIWNR